VTKVRGHDAFALVYEQLTRNPHAVAFAKAEDALN
jgi:hypothetical protein